MRSWLSLQGHTRLAWLAMEISDAVEMGERNKEVIELFRNWCAHVDVVIAGGVGLVEEMTGLPIGMRSFRCPHARGLGIAGMRLEEVAIDFYRRNCADCKQRAPVRLPNLSEIVNARDAEQDRKEAERVRAAAASAAVVAGRVSARVSLRVPGDHARNSVVDLLDAFDSDPSDGNLQALLESSRAVPEVFCGDIEKALLDLAADRGSRATGALKLLDAFTEDRKRLEATALRTLARGSTDSLAGEIVARGIDPANTALVADAVPSLIFIARPPFPRYPGLGEPDMVPGPLVAAFRAAPEAVTVGLRRWLRDQDKEKRRSAALALQELMKAAAPEVALPLVGDLLASFVQKDDIYDGGEAAVSVARVLSAVLVAHPVEVDRELRDAFAMNDPRVALGVARTYVRVFRPGRWGETTVRPAAATLVQRLAFEWMVSTISSLPQDPQIADEILGVLSRPDAVPWDVAVGAAPTLLGVVALAHDEFATPPKDVVLKPPEQEFVRHLGRQNRRIHLQNVAQAALGMVREIVATHPDAATRLETLKLITSTLEKVPETAGTLRAELTGALGSFATTPEHGVVILPLVYRGMTDASTGVRGAALAAYADLVERMGPDSVPQLLHQLAVSMLGDPYVFVHESAVEALSGVRLPEALVAEATRALVVVILAHAGERNSRIASMALGLWLRLLGRLGNRTAEHKAVALSVVARLEVNEAAQFLTRYDDALRDGRGYAEILLRLLADEKRWDTSTTRLLDSAEDLTRDEVNRNAESLIALAARFAHSEVPGRLMEADSAAACFHLLAKHGCWSAASKVAHARVDAVPDTTESTPRRLRLQVEAAEVDLELAATNAQATSVVALTARLRQLEGLIVTDEERNADARRRFPATRRAPHRD